MGAELNNVQLVKHEWDVARSCCVDTVFKVRILHMVMVKHYRLRQLLIEVQWNNPVRCYLGKVIRAIKKIRWNFPVPV